MQPKPPDQNRRHDYASCYAVWDEDELTVGNRWIERRWRLQRGALHAVSIRDKASGTEWLAGPSAFPAPCLAKRPAGEVRESLFRCAEGKRSAVEEPSLVIEWQVADDAGTRTFRFQIFPDAAAVRVQLISGERTGGGVATTGTPADEEKPTGIETTPNTGVAVEVPDCLENFTLGPQHFRLLRIELQDRTDVHDELVFEQEWLPQFSAWNLALTGNLFIVEETLGGSGLIFVKHAPLPHARPIPCEVDLTFAGRSRQLTLRGHGIGPDGGEGYPFAVLTYNGGKFGRTAALQNYQRQLRAFVPGRDGLLLSNTWGDRSRDARVNEEFMSREVEAGARLGVDVIQIDDGWERGVTSNSAQAAAAGGVWNGFWAANPDFWDPHPERFPHGLDGVIARARERGMRFGLWFAPDSSEDFANWRRDADKLIELHERLGVCYFKIDGVKADTRAGERNLHRLFDAVLHASAGRVVFDLDVTAETRPGYFGIVNSGPIFVENRYTDWRNYWPHQTLRNLWKLAHYVDPLRLRMEFLNNARNAPLYGDDPLAPARYRPDYLFATVMFCNPLGWFETSGLPDAYFEQAAPLVRTWKQHRDAVFRGCVHPIGNAPDGTAWTGFFSVGNGVGHALIFREFNGQDFHEFDLPMELTDAEITLLGGEGRAEFANGRLRVHLPTPRSFLFAQWKNQP